MPRLIIAAVAAATLIFVPAARADGISVTLPSPETTRAPSIEIVVSPAATALQCRVDDKPFADCSSPWRPDVDGDGMHTYDVVAGAFIVGSHFTLDRTGPAIDVTSGPDDDATQISPSVVYSFTAQDLHGVAATTCTWDDVAADCPDGTTPRTLATGAHVLAITASDSLGNTSTLKRHITIASAQVIVDPGPTPTPTATTTPDVVPSHGGVLSAGATHATASLRIKKRTRGWTQLKSLTLRGVPAGTTIKVSCQGTGCPSKPATQNAAKAGDVTINGIAGRRLRPGARITLTLTQPGAKPQTIRILVRSTRGPQIT
jgi:hypothetical protein